MEELLYCDVVGIYGADRHGVDVIAVGHSIVTQVVADCCQKEGEGVQLVKTELL